MPVIDMHAHWLPYEYRDAIASCGEWHGMDAHSAEYQLVGMRLSAEQRIDDMDAQGVDMQMLSPQAGFYQYDRPAAVASVIARECNDSILGVVEKHSSRFCGVGTVPLQDVDAAVRELVRVRSLGLKGVMIGDHVMGSTFEEEKFLPFWAAVEETGALVFFHQGFDQRYRVGKFHFDNSVGNLVEHTLNFGVLAAGGVLDRFPELKLMFAHAGGYIPYAVARMDKVAGGYQMDDPGRHTEYSPPYLNLPVYNSSAERLPSQYLRRFYYDCIAYSGTNLRFLIDAVGVDRVVFGSDLPCPMVLTDGVRWIQGLKELTDAEKKAILVDNATRLLEI
jgi:aminocarboxymuconate-semialdehyde decarboxylase